MKQQKYKGFRCSPMTRRKGNSKDTKRWCRGVVGREHRKVWTRRQAISQWFDLLCTVCEKHFDYCVIFFAGDKCKCGNHRADQKPVVEVAVRKKRKRK